MQLALQPDGVIETNTGSALNAILAGPYDTTAFMNTLAQITGTFNATVVFEGSNDETNPTNWFQLMCVNCTSGAIATSATAVGLYYVPSTVRWMRTRISSYSSGTVTCATMYSMDAVPFIQSAGGSSQLSVAPANSGVAGYSVSRISTGASGVIKASQGRVYSWALQNTNAAIRYLQIYNKTTAGVPGTDTPYITIPLSANGSVPFSDQIGTIANTGLSWAITTDAAGATAGASGDVVGTIFYT